MELLQCENEELTELTTAAVMILSSCASNKQAIASSGAIHLLVGLLSSEYMNENGMSSITMQTKLDAVSTLHNLSTCHHIVPVIVSTGVVFTLLQIIHGHDKSSELAEKTMALLESVVSSSEGALQETASTVGAIRALVEALEEGSPQCKEHAVGILLLVCQSCRERYRGMILREGVMPGLLQLSVDGTWRAKETAHELLLLLREQPDFNSRGEQLQHELIEQIMQEIDSEGETVVGTTLRMDDCKA